VHKKNQWGSTVGLVSLAFALTGCGLLDAGGPAAAGLSTGPPVVITEPASPSALVAVLTGPSPGPALSDLVNATARPREDLVVVQPGAPLKTVLSSASKPPPTVVVAGMPIKPRGAQTPYQTAEYRGRLERWRDAVAAGRRAEAGQARDALSAWLRGLGLLGKLGRLEDPPESAGSLNAESAAAASALAGLEEESGNEFGDRRVIVLYCNDLVGRPPAGQLTGDTVLVITTYLPTAAAASAAQANLLAAGAAQAAVIGPEVTSTRLAALVSAGLGHRGTRESVSAPVLFANNSAALSPTAVAHLTTLLPQLRAAGVTAIINGFTSTPGTALTNYTLSYERAANVASFLESNGVPRSSLIIVGHGASDLIAPGNSGQNRRVTVVIETPS
jgi:outer membrane protein OmpA-like peptidoglycan-associated protein